VDPTYPEGDTAAVATTWKAPRATDGLTREMIEAAFAEIRTSSYGSSTNGRGKDRWCGKVLMEKANRTEVQAKALLGHWIEAGVLEEGTDKGPDRKDRVRLLVNEEKAAEMLDGRYIDLPTSEDDDGSIHDLMKEAA
jgi:hypothetical protein